MGKSIIGRRVCVQVGGEPPKVDDAIVGDDVSVYVPSGDTDKRMGIIYKEINLETVMKYFVDGFDQDVSSYEWFCDAAKRKVIFKLYYVEPEEG